MACQNQSIGPFSLTQTITTFLNGSIFHRLPSTYLLSFLFTVFLSYLQLCPHSPFSTCTLFLSYTAFLSYLSRHLPFFSLIFLLSYRLLSCLSSILPSSSVTAFLSNLARHLPFFSLIFLLSYRPLSCLSSHLPSSSVTVLFVNFPFLTFLPPQLPPFSYMYIYIHVHTYRRGVRVTGR